MKKWMKRISLVAVIIVLMPTLVSGGSVNAEVSRVTYFTIQSNTVCVDQGGSATSVYLNLTNTSNIPTEVTLFLYNDAGALITDKQSAASISNSGYKSQITPGDTTTLSAKSTEHYLGLFGSIGASCANRPAFGKIVINSDSGLVLAGGEIKGQSNVASPSVVLTNTPIIVNSGQPF
ncbi:hypothetical protein NKT34_00345 [Paenibacillus polysaccharolyticus]|uniref:hypothetical protein n=1 Tax=Paenibacillus polysaccharolyticus TaxID=582692 RepID=UPI0020A0435A|nr:hypothetical protein [Paenibacillus polysaccharolyticus]MCP1131762.1 hypothetical protein [Paenibacillus polysaccharolyticus]